MFSMPRESFRYRHYPGKIRVHGDSAGADFQSQRSRQEPRTPCFDAEYAAMYGAPVLPAIEAILMMRPQFRSSIPGSAARVQRKVPVRFNLEMALPDRLISFQKGAVSAMPALLTRMSGPRPNFSTRLRKRADNALGIRHVAFDGQRLDAKLGGNFSGRRFVDLSSCARCQPRDRCALSAES